MRSATRRRACPRACLPRTHARHARHASPTRMLHATPCHATSCHVTSCTQGLTLNQCLEYCNGPLTWEDGACKASRAHMFNRQAFFKKIVGPNKGDSVPAGSAGCCMWKEKDGGKCYAHLGSGLKEGDRCASSLQNARMHNAR